MNRDEPRDLVDVIVPALGEAVTSAILVVWWVEPQGRTTKGQPLFEVGTAKTVFQVESEVDGVLAEVLVRNGESVHSGLIVGRIRPF